jgi:hypothetical protein
MLSGIAKNIITSRLYDKGIKINPSDLDNYIVDAGSFNTLNDMYDFIVNNFNSLIIL